MRALLDLLRRTPGTIFGLLVGVVSMAVWVPRALPPTVPPVPAEEAGVALALSPRLDAGSTFEISPEILAARAAAPAATAPSRGRPASPAGAAAAAETVPAAVVTARAVPARRPPPPPPPSRPPRRFVYAPPGDATARVPSVPTAARGIGGGPAPAADDFGLTADDVSTIALRPDDFGITSP